MQLEIISPQDTIYQGEVKNVKLCGLDGKFQILDNHAPIVSALKKGDIKIIDIENKEHIFNINGGLLEMNDNKIHILAQ